MKKLGLFVAVLSLSMGALAHEMTAEQRKQKIDVYEKMSERYKTAAECLKQGKALDDCNMAAMKDCPMMGKNCPFTESGHMDKEMMREHMKKMKEDKKVD